MLKKRLTIPDSPSLWTASNRKPTNQQKMNVITTKQKVISSEGISSKDCSFDTEDSGYMASLLRDSIYSNKELAAIRETTTNAMDSHFDSGIQDKPIHVKLPTLEDKTCSIRDFGNGISFERMDTAYNLFGKSTKREDNFQSENQAGCFGIGRFAPLAIEGNDSFIVKTFQNGKLGVYEVRINDKNNNTVYNIGTFDTDQPNGLEISFSIGDCEVNYFNRTAKECFSFFSVLPVITNDPSFSFGDHIPEFDFEKDLSDGVKYKIRRKNDGQKKVIMANIAYNFDKHELLRKIESSFSEKDYNNIDDLLNSFSIHLYVLPKEVSFPPSRENLTLDKKTVINLGNYFLKIYDNLVEDYSKKISATKTLKEALALSKKVFPFYRKVYDELSFNGVFLNIFHPFKISGKNYYFRSKVRGYGRVLKSDNTDRIHFDEIEKLYINIEGKRSAAKFKDNIESDSREDNIEIKEPKELENLINLVGGKDKLGIEIVDISNWSFEVKTRTGAKASNLSKVEKKSGVKFFKFKYSDVSDRRCSKPLTEDEIDELDELEEKYYIPTKHFSVKNSSARLEFFEYEAARITFEIKNIYIIRENDIKDLESSWVNLDEKIKSEIKHKKYDIRKSIINAHPSFRIYSHENSSMFGLSLYKSIIKKDKSPLKIEISERSVDYSFSYDCENCYHSYLKHSKISTEKFFEYPKINGNKIHKALISAHDALKEQSESISKKYEILKYIDFEKSGSIEYLRKNKEKILNI